MNKKTAGWSFLGVCLVLAALLMTKVISIPISGAIFAIALVVFGLMSGGLKREDSHNRTL